MSHAVPVKTLLVVLNAKAGSIVANPADVEAGVRRALEEAGVDARIAIVAPAEIDAAVRDGVARGVDVIFVGGGDGTQSMAARRIAGTKTALGVLPLGTRNHFARDLKIPLDLLEALKALLVGEVTEVDLGDLNGTTFINNASIGLYPQAVKRREWHQHRIGMNKATAMLIAIINVFWRYPLHVLRLRWERRDALVATPFVFVGNNEYVFGLTDFGRRASLQEGKLSVYYAHKLGRARFLWTATKALFGLIAEGLDLFKVLTRDLEVETRHKRIAVALDGEVRAFDAPLKFGVRPRALRVVIPGPPA